MNDFADLERELKKLQPMKPSASLFSRIGVSLADAPKAADNVITPNRFRMRWMGLGLAAAAAFLVLARINFRPATKTEPQVTSASPTIQRNIAEAPAYQAAALTQVVYHTWDEGLVFPPDDERPARRVRTAKRESLQWRNPQTGASLRISYPAEEVSLIPVSGQ